jgi:hypothetical protein
MLRILKMYGMANLLLSNSSIIHRDNTKPSILRDLLKHNNKYILISFRLKYNSKRQTAESLHDHTGEIFLYDFFSYASNDESSRIMKNRQRNPRMVSVTLLCRQVALPLPQVVLRGYSQSHLYLILLLRKDQVLGCLNLHHIRGKISDQCLQRLICSPLVHHPVQASIQEHKSSHRMRGTMYVTH